MSPPPQRIFALLLPLILLPPLIHAHPSASQALISTTTSEYLHTQGQPARVLYNTFSAPAFVKDLFHAIFNHSSAGPADALRPDALAAAPPRVVLVVFSRAMSHPAAEQNEVREGLQALLDASPAWISVPYITLEAADAEHERVSLKDMFESALASVRDSRSDVRNPEMPGSCGADKEGEDIFAAPRALQKLASENGQSTDVVFLCLQDRDLSQDAELKLIGSLDEALQRAERESGAQYLFINTAEPVRETAPMRSLLQTILSESAESPSEDQTADELFKLQADLLKVLIVLVFTLVAVVSGFCCLMSLDTPTKFETPKDAMQ